MMVQLIQACDLYSNKYGSFKITVFQLFQAVYSLYSKQMKQASYVGMFISEYLHILE